MKAVHRMDREGALALLRRVPVVHVASTTPDGEPILRTVHAVVVDDALAFHGAPAGEKAETVGRTAFVSAEETVATLPSYFIDAQRACPATTYYLSVHVQGPLERVDDAREKARALEALMHKLQPEGGYVPIDPEHPLYAKTVGSLLVVRVPLERLIGKAKLGQHRSTADVARVVEGLWKRGAPGDVRAIERVLAANPAVPTPAWLVGPAGTRLVGALEDGEVDEAVALVAGEYWNEGVAPERLARAMRASAALVGAREVESGRLVATARAVSDGARNALVCDVAVAKEWRGRGLGKAVVRLVLDHPAVRDADRVRLGTRDAQKLYERFGFVDVAAEPRPYVSTQMIRRRRQA
jgi:ribosomal protein S18 acetylase RimI-like enzyme/nitroimidazol reductase NimA-like FMN-containing flavoprotein (pyridoxamine 5'-phosphate oxidase superfamily)